MEPEISVFRPDRPGIRKVLGDLEAEIMELLWERPVGQGTAVRDIFAILYERRRTRGGLLTATRQNTVAPRPARLRDDALTKRPTS